MIPRYRRPEMAALFEPEAKLRLWLEVELQVAEVLAELGRIPSEPVARLRRRAQELEERLTDPRRVEEIERTTRHDVIAFLTHLEEVLGPDARFLHLGMTSSDLLDTALALQLGRAGELVLEGLARLKEALKERAFAFKDTPCIARSHGVHAEPTTFGLKLAGHYAEFARAERRFAEALEEVRVCKLSGAVGTYAHLDPEVERRVAERLGLRPETVATQVVPRDRHAALVMALALVAAAVERLAVEIRHLQRTEVREVQEPFGAGQKGSSAMPHKRNPILSENLTGLSRMIRAQVAPALENVVLWHERDISHSSVERVLLPDAFMLTDFALHRLAHVIRGLLVDRARMAQNLALTGGLIHSQRVLLALTEAGLPRQRAYEIVQRHAMAVWDQGGNLLDRLRGDAEVRAHLSEQELEALFDVRFHLRHVDHIFARVFARPSANLNPRARE